MTWNTAIGCRGLGSAARSSRRSKETEAGLERLQGVAAVCGETRAPAIITLICKSSSEIKAQVNVC